MAKYLSNIIVSRLKKDFSKIEITSKSLLSNKTKLLKEEPLVIDEAKGAINDNLEALLGFYKLLKGRSFNKHISPANLRKSRLNPKEINIRISANNRKEKELKILTIKVTKQLISNLHNSALNHANHDRWIEAEPTISIAINIIESENNVRQNNLAQIYGLELLTWYMKTGNHPALRNRLKFVIENIVDTAGLRMFLARLYIMVRQYQNAWNILDYPSILNNPSGEALLLLNIILKNKGKAWDKHPCNYYTYKNILLNNEKINIYRQQNAEDSKNKLMIDAILDCHEAWNNGINQINKGQYLPSIRYLLKAKELIANYLERFKGTSDPNKLLVYGQKWRIRGVEYRTPLAVLTHFRDRYKALSLKELYEIDWERPLVSKEGFNAYNSYTELKKIVSTWPRKCNEKIDAPLIAMLFVFIPMTIAEASKARNKYNDSDDIPGLGTITGALTSINTVFTSHKKFKLLSEFIERPFCSLLKGQILLQKADSEYKSEKADKHPQYDSTGKLLFRGLKAARTYKGVSDVFHSNGLSGYNQKISVGEDYLSNQMKNLLQERLLYDQKEISLVKYLYNRNIPLNRNYNEAPYNTRIKFKQLGYNVQIPGIKGTDKLMGITHSKSPHKRLVSFNSFNNSEIENDSNPLIYSIIAEAKYKLLQLAGDFNYLGYRDDYVPPWRFSFLLERARYYTLHTRQVQNTYLTFLSNSEREELQEQSASQNVVIEKANLNTETQKLNQARAQLEASKANTALANLVAINAEYKYNNFVSLDVELDRLTDDYCSASTGAFLFGGGAAMIGGAAGGAVLGSAVPVIGTAVGAVVGGIAGLLTGGGSAYFQQKMQKIQMEMQSLQREFEKENYRLAAEEAKASAIVAHKQQEVSRIGVSVAAWQRIAAIMRHEFAVDTLEFLQNRTLNTELWYRLSNSLKEIAKSYMKYSVELAFLAEQAYEFETGTRKDVIRFDYELSEVGDFLAADFLLRDLDSLEYSMISDGKEKRQVKKFFISLAREYPNLLQELKNTGTTEIPVTLRMLEQRFPGMYNMRITSINILPLALMDPSRYAIMVSNLGHSKVRIKKPATSEVGNQNNQDPFAGTDINSWCPQVDNEWPVKLRLVKPETQVFSGLSRQEFLMENENFGQNQRTIFEDIGAASTWQIEMSMTENRIDPRSISDFIIELNISGYFDPELSENVKACIPRIESQTLMLSAHHNFPDSFYNFKNNFNSQSNSSLIWNVNEDWIPVGLHANEITSSNR